MKEYVKDVEVSNVLPTNELTTIPKPWLTLDETEEDPYRSYLFYGPSGVMKTRLCAQMDRPLILACDPRKKGGVTTALDLKPNYIHIKTYMQLLDLLPRLKPFAGKPDGFNTLCLDSASYFHRIIMTDVLTYSNREYARFDDWNLGQTRMRSIIMKLSEFDCNIVFTATDNIIKDEFTGKIRGVPKMPGQLADELPQAVDICLRLYTISGWGTDGRKFVKYRMSWVPDDPWVYGKDGSNTLPTEVITGGDALKHLWEVKK